MNLFNKKLTFDEIMHYNSILDGNGMDVETLLVHNALHPPTPISQLAPIHLPKSQQKTETETETETHKKNKNKKRQYIKLPNARIKRHQHQYRKHKIERNDETKRSRNN